MKTKTLTTILLCFLLFQSYSQENIVNNRITINSQYQFTKFTNATIKFNDEAILTALLNYNIVLEKMQFIDEDIVRNLENPDIKYITILNFKYIPVNGKYYQEVYRNDHFRLLLLKKPDLSSTNKISGAYNSSNETISTNQLNSVQVESGGHNDNVVVIENDKADAIPVNNKYFFLSLKGKLISPSKKEIYKLSKKSKEDVNKFLLENEIDFSNEENLTKLLIYLEQ